MRLNGTVRGLLIIAAVAGVIVVLDLRVTLSLIVLLAQIAFFLATAYVVFLVWREQREGISMWSLRAQWVFYGSAVVAVADVAVYRYVPRQGAMQLIAFVATLALCGLAMFRTWRDQHTYV